MAKILVCETRGEKLALGELDHLLRHGESWSAAVARIFQGEIEGMTMTLKQPDESEELFYLEDQP